MLLVRLADEWASFLPAGTLESFRADLGLTYSQAGAVLALIAPGALLGSAAAVAADHVSRRALAAAGGLVYAGSLAAFALGDSFAVMAVAALALGAGATAMVEVAEVALVDMAGDDLRRYLARSNLLGTVGDFLGPALVVGTAALGLSWRAVFAAGAAVLVVYAAVLAAVPLPGPSHEPAEEEGNGASVRGVLGAVLRDPAVWVLGLIGVLLTPFDEDLLGFTIALLRQDGGVSTAAAASVALVGVAGGLVSYTVLARRFEGVPDQRLLLASVALMGLGAAIIAAVPLLPVVAVAAFAVSVGLNLGWLALQHRTLTLRPGQVGTTSAVLGAIELAGFWIPISIGAVADAHGLPVAVGAYAALAVAMAGLCRSGYLAGRSRRRRRPARMATRRP